PRRLTPAETGGAPSPEEVLAAVFAELDPLALGGAVGVVSGISLFVMAAVLLLKGGPAVGPNLALLRYYLPGFAVTWGGAAVGCLEAGVGGFVLGYVGAWLRNWGVTAYAALLRHRAEARARRDLLDKV
ncbi:MAG TPA: hypothetical protein VKJ47_09805, partial [Candidatus Binatia bacterium]|nr:hypothetical protein [Candidatus Binatia bacterium]